MDDWKKILSFNFNFTFTFYSLLKTNVELKKLR